MMNLKSCPFCGASMDAIRLVHVRYAKPTFCEIRCRCGAGIGGDLNATDEGTETALIDYLIERWNRRAANA